MAVMRQSLVPGIVAVALFTGTVAWAGASSPIAGAITAGRANVSACSTAARVTLQTAYSSSVHGYAISGARLATDAA